MIWPLRLLLQRACRICESNFFRRERLLLFNPRRKIFWTLDARTNNICRLKLKSFQKFDSAATALEEVASLVEGKVSPRLSSLLDEIKEEKKVSLAVADPKLGM